jgi:hypothetical protein
MMLLRTADTGAFLGCSNFPKCRNIRPAPPGIAPLKKSRDDAEGFQVPFYLGPDDRYPRPLFWALMLMLLIDIAVALPPFLTLLHGDPNQAYYGRQLVGTGIRMVLPALFLIPIVLGYSVVAAGFAGLKLLGVLQVIVGAVGTSLAEQSVNVGQTVLLAVWHASCLVVAAWYFMVRRDA